MKRFLFLVFLLVSLSFIIISCGSGSSDNTNGDGNDDGGDGDNNSDDDNVVDVTLPTLGEAVSNSDGFPVTRITDKSSAGGFGTQIYSQLQAFSADNEYVLLIEDEVYVIRRLDDLSLVEGIDSSGWNDPRWHPTQAHVIIHFDSNEDTTLRVQQTDVDTQTTTTVFTFPSPYERIRANQSFDELSRDGVWLTGMASQTSGANVIFSLNLETRDLGAELTLSDLYNGTCETDPDYGELEPDWTAPSPLGRYLVVQWVRDGTTRCSGLETFNIETGAWVGRVTYRHQHGDLCVKTDGTTECFMTFEEAHELDNNRDGIGLRDLPGTSTVSDTTYLAILNFDGDHISCQGPSGVCLVTTRDSDSGDEGRLFLQYMNNTTVDIAHHQSSGCGYWVQPRASFSADGSYAIYASDLGSNANCTDGGTGSGEAYLVNITSEAL